MSSERSAALYVGVCAGQTSCRLWSAQSGRRNIEGGAGGQRLYLDELAALPLSDVVGRVRRVRGLVELDQPGGGLRVGLRDRGVELSGVRAAGLGECVGQHFGDRVANRRRGVVRVAGVLLAERGGDDGELSGLSLAGAPVAV